MINLSGWDEVSADGFYNLPYDAYKCTIVNVFLANSKSGNEMLAIDFDIADGDHQFYFRDETNRMRKNFPDVTWSNNARLYIVLRVEGKLNWRLKKFLSHVQKSNADFVIDPSKFFDERSLVGKACGVIFKGKESKSTKKDGSRYVNTVLHDTCSIQDVIDGNFSVPEIERYTGNDAPPSYSFSNSTPIDDSDTPF